MPDPLSNAAIVDNLIAYAQRDGAYPQFNSLVGAHQYQRLYRLCDKYLEPGGSVLDWGCGNGHFSYYLVHKAYETYGFAFEPFPLLPELLTLGLQFQQGCLANPVQLPYADGQFDAVISVGVLEHVKELQGDDLGSMQEIYRILKPSGIFICYHLPNHYSLIEWLAARLPGKYHHQDRYTRADIETLCTQAQFNLLEVKRYGFLPRNLFGSWRWASHSQLLTAGWDSCDNLLSQLLSRLCQNYYFVGQK